MMAMFSRRTIQRLIDENADFLSGKQSESHVSKLNLHNESVLATEWEIVLLNAFSKLGKLFHEPNWGGTRPDIHFSSLYHPEQSLIAEIVTVSDKGIEEQFPINALSAEVLRIASENGLRENSFEIKVNDELDNGTFDYEERVLILPGRARFQETILNERFSKFIERIVQAPNECLQYQVSYEGSNVFITYRPTQGFVMVGYPSYKRASSLTQNTVYSSLERKANQLSGCNGPKSPLAIILCDGGNDLLRSGHQWGEKHIGKVVRQFLHYYPSISFVLTVVVKQHFRNKRQSEVITTLYKGDSFHLVGDKIIDSINGLVEVMPTPERDAVNAIHLIKGSHAHEGQSFYGGFSITNDEIRISARALLDFFAGRMSQEEFLSAYHFIPGVVQSSNMWNPFAKKRQQGRLISEITIENTGTERDDDWLAIRFGPPDPAIGPFCTPGQHSTEERTDVDLIK